MWLVTYHHSLRNTALKDLFNLDANTLSVHTLLNLSAGDALLFQARRSILWWAGEPQPDRCGQCFLGLSLLWCQVAVCSAHHQPEGGGRGPLTHSLSPALCRVYSTRQFHPSTWLYEAMWCPRLCTLGGWSAAGWGLARHGDFRGWRRRAGWHSAKRLGWRSTGAQTGLRGKNNFVSQSVSYFVRIASQSNKYLCFLGGQCWSRVPSITSLWDSVVQCALTEMPLSLFLFLIKWNKKLGQEIFTCNADVIVCIKGFLHSEQSEHLHKPIFHIKHFVPRHCVAKTLHVGDTLTSGINPGCCNRTKLETHTHHLVHFKI